MSKYNIESTVTNIGELNSIPVPSQTPQDSLYCTEIGLIDLLYGEYEIKDSETSTTGREMI